MPTTFQKSFGQSHIGRFATHGKSGDSGPFLGESLTLVGKKDKCNEALNAPTNIKMPRTMCRGPWLKRRWVFRGYRNPSPLGSSIVSGRFKRAHCLPVRASIVASDVARLLSMASFARRFDESEAEVSESEVVVEGDNAGRRCRDVTLTSRGSGPRKTPQSPFISSRPTSFIAIVLNDSGS
jgi:hypothetical protein